MSNQDKNSSSELRGIGGWLRFFILGLTFMVPLWSVAVLGMLVITLVPSGQFGGLESAVIMVMVCMIGAGSFYTGNQLRKIKTRAVQLAKKYVLVVLGLNIAAAPASPI